MEQDVMLPALRMGGSESVSMNTGIIPTPQNVGMEGLERRTMPYLYEGREMEPLLQAPVITAI